MSYFQSPIVGLCGFARVGKDSIGRHFVDRGWRRVAFADALKQEAADFLGISLAEIERRKEVFRPLLVGLGAARRAIDPRHWINAVERRVMELAIANVPVIITDVRYRNEAEWIQMYGGEVAYVHRDDVSAANEEEARSIAELMENVKDVLVVDNRQDRVLEAAARLYDRVRKPTSSRPIVLGHREDDQPLAA